MRGGDDQAGLVFRAARATGGIEANARIGELGESPADREDNGNYDHDKHNAQHEDGICDCASRKSGVAKYVMVVVLLLFLGCAGYFVQQILNVSNSQLNPSNQSDSKSTNKQKAPSKRSFKDANKHHVTIVKKYKRHTLSKTAGLTILPGRLLVECTQDFTTSGVYILGINDVFNEIENLIAAGSLQSFEDGRACFAATSKSGSKHLSLYHLEASFGKLFKTKIVSQHRFPKLLPTEERESLILPPEIKHPVCGCPSNPTGSQNKAFIFHDTDGFSTLTEIDLIPKKSKLTSLRQISQFLDSSNKPRRLQVTAVAWLGNFLLLSTTQNHILHLLNPQNMKLVDSIDLSQIHADHAEDEHSYLSHTPDTKDTTTAANTHKNIIGRSEHFTGLAVDPESGEIYVTGRRWLSVYRLRVLGFGV